MGKNFNSYADSEEILRFWTNLCREEGTLRHYEPGDHFIQEGEVAPYFGHILEGALKYVTYDREGTEHVMGLEFKNGFVTDFPFSFTGQKSRLSVVAVTPCDILCVPSKRIGEMIRENADMMKMIAASTELVFGMVYDRYKNLYTLSASERYLDLISHYPDLFAIYPLKDIASFLRITPTHLSRLRKSVFNKC
ncbi:MAG: Crp/Fnr family transcriptional regulator [Bacteroidales bacterium]|nr:Crp/Fnr family transcriptional regulator [Bacteroidales bacterium]MBD5209180.1 Crp/Fnr family transcriptional regulator [Bacteroidales bacterium]